MDCPELELADAYHEGFDLERDYEKALEWYFKATRPSKAFPEGHPESYYRIGTMYYDGRGVATDYPRAARYFRKAALLGVVGGQIATAFMLYFGEGCRQNKNEALWWLEQAARQGCADAQLLFAENLEDYHPAEAYYWFVVAANNAEIDEGHRKKATIALDDIRPRISSEAAEAIEQSARAGWNN